MSSSNLVEVTLIEETVYGETPTGTFKTARFTSESLSGTPETTESQLLRSDRMSSGQVNTGLTVQGDINTELAKEDVVDLFIASAMNSTWVASTDVNVDLTITVASRTLTRATGDWTATPVRVGDVMTLGGFTNVINNTEIMVSRIIDANDIEFVGPDDLVDEASSSNTYRVADYIEVGLVQKSFSIQKHFKDLATKAIIYKGMLVNTMSINVSYGAIVTSTFSFLGNDTYPVDQANDFITDGQAIDPAATTTPLNGSIDMPFILTDDGTVIGPAIFCIQSLEMNLNNNNTPQTCIGKPAPQSYSLGTALPEITLSSYLDDQNWSYLSKKITQEPVSLGFLVRNAGGFYAVFLPAVQLSFDDPASAGQNQDVIMSMSGVAKVGENQEKSVVIYRTPA